MLAKHTVRSRPQREQRNLPAFAFAWLLLSDCIVTAPGCVKAEAAAAFAADATLSHGFGGAL